MKNLRMMKRRGLLMRNQYKRELLREWSLKMLIKSRKEKKLSKKRKSTRSQWNYT